MGMEQNPDQDFLGELYMLCELGNDASGQFFTPYDVCRCMVEVSGEATRRQRMPDSFRFGPGLRCGRTADCFCQPVQEKKISATTTRCFLWRRILT